VIIVNRAQVARAVWSRCVERHYRCLRREGCGRSAVALEHHDFERPVRRGVFLNELIGTKIRNQRALADCRDGGQGCERGQPAGCYLEPQRPVGHGRSLRSGGMAGGSNRSKRALRKYVTGDRQRPKASRAIQTKVTPIAGIVGTSPSVTTWKPNRYWVSISALNRTNAVAKTVGIERMAATGTPQATKVNRSMGFVLEG